VGVPVGLTALVLVALAAGIALRPAATDPRLDLALQPVLNNAAPFSSDLAMETGPRFSPDGARVAFALGDTEKARIVVQEFGRIDPCAI
jgi:hypothetical protein